MKVIVENFMGEKIQLSISESSYPINDFELVCEAQNWDKILKDGEVRICHFPMFPPLHQDRPAIIIKNEWIGPLVMATAHIEDGKDEWKAYPQNIFIVDWKQEKFKLPSYANTKMLLEPSEVKIYGHMSFLTKGDYNRIVKPTLARLTSEQLDSMFESYDLENIMDILKS